MSNSPPIDSPPKHAPSTPHPPRLQHSPSLPNIWSCHCSGINTREMDKQDNDNLHRPSAPSSPKGKPPAAVTDKVLQIRHVKYASIDPTYRKPSGSKTHARRRTERDEPHSLLTPPLTPSSSIRTTASSEGAASAAAPPAHDFNESTCEEILDPDVVSTRILLLENISLNVTVPFLESAVVDALAGAVTQSTMTTDQITPRLSSAAHEIIKGINLDPLRQRNEGIIPLVFFDVRSAKIARDVILNKEFDDRLRQCIGGGGRGDAPPMELSARLITLDELCKILGNSRFLDGIDGSFSFSVQKIQYKNNEGDQPVASIEEISEDQAVDGSASSASLKDTPFTRGGIDPVVVQNILKRFGSIRFLKFIQQEVDQQGNSKVVYHVEFYDMRDAETASLELQQQITFGMKICILDGRVATEVEPFPNPATAGPSFNGLSISPAGAQSQIRQRFAFTVSNENSLQSQPLAEQSTAGHSTTSTGGASSPTFFYATMPSEAPNQNYQVMRQEPGLPNVRGNSQEAGGSSQLQMIPRPALHEQYWEPEPVYRGDCISPSYGPDGLCHYCPSRGAPHGIAYTPPFPPYAFSPSPPTPPIYYPGHIATPQIVPNMINLGPSPAPTMLAYEYVDPRMQPASYQGSWNYDPAIAAMGPGLNAPSPAPFFLREDGTSARGGNRHHVPYTRSPNPASQTNEAHPQLRLESNAPVLSQNSYRALHLIEPSSKSPASDHSAALVAAGAGDTGPAAGHDRNQLNLARIISGEDTRTTIMIKNIPNKMSDGDLTAYIGKVCPRKIDFLYLRMDFKNGCNVGYAFVNFIDVEALIHFARERLGAKWNMFSSEKVLQMSYANYQGKEALVEKFKNSAIMDERESWRPRIFYSSGDNAGLPESFPAPTHIGRKERSSYNRDTLFPPGVNSHTIAAQSHGLLQNTPRRYLDDMRSFQNHGRSGGGERYRSHGHNADESGEPRRASMFRNSSQRTAR